MKRLLSLVLSLLLLAAMLCACGGSDGDGTTTPTGDTTSTEPPTEKKEPTTISFFGVDVRAVEGCSLRDGLWVWEEIGKKLNQNYTFNTTVEYWDLINLRLFSGEKLEDLYCLGYNDMQKPANEGLFLPLNDLIEQYGPNIKKIMEESPAKYVANNSLRDGKMYAFSESIYRCTEVDTVLLIGRKDWFDKLNLTTPETTDEFFDALMVIKNGDPNENGTQDEIPLGGNINQLEQFLSGSFGLHGCRNSFIWAENGKVYMERTTDKYKEFLMYLNKLYQNGLAGCFYEFPKNTVAVNWTLYGSVESSSTTDVSNIPRLLMDVPGAEALGLLPPKGSDGKLVLEELYTEGKRYVIPKDCQHPEEVIKLIDYLWSDEGWLLYEYGIEGEDYNMVDSEPVATEKITSSGNIEAEYEERGIGIQIIPRIFKPISNARKAARPVLVEEPFSKMYDYLTPGYYLNLLSITEEETKIVDNADLNAYIADSFVKFVKGEMSFDKWDDYQAQLKKMGIDEVCAVYQDIYDRNYKK